MHKKRCAKNKTVPAEKLTKVLTDGFAGTELLFTFQTSDSSKRWIEQCLADFAFILASRGTRYCLRSNFQEEYCFNQEDDYFSEYDESEQSDEKMNEGDLEGFIVTEIDNDLILAKSRKTLMKKQFGALRVYRRINGYRKTPLITVNMQLGRFMSLARQWGVKKDDENLSDDPYYCWIEVPIQEPRRKLCRKKLTQ